MTIRRFVFSCVVAFLLLCQRVEAGKVPLSPEELLAQSKLIVTGQSQSHREEDREQSDGSVTRSVFLTVKVDTVLKGDAKPGDVIQVVCWVVVREPRDGIVWDSGHGGIPADGGRAKFFLDNNKNGVWLVIYPNGLERLDSTPPLEYKREPPVRSHVLPPAADPPWILFIVLAVVVVGIAAAVLIATRRSSPSA